MNGGRISAHRTTAGTARLELEEVPPVVADVLPQGGDHLSARDVHHAEATDPLLAPPRLF